MSLDARKILADAILGLKWSDMLLVGEQVLNHFTSAGLSPTEAMEGGSMGDFESNALAANALVEWAEICNEEYESDQRAKANPGC